MRIVFAVLPLLALAACGSEPDPAPTPTPSATDAAPRTLVAAGFNDQGLGPRIVGPQGDEVVSEIIAEDGTRLGEMTSYVTCPAPEDEDDTDTPADEQDSCDPETLGEDAVFTYVHRITLGDPDAAPAEAGSEDDAASAPATAMVFRMTRSPAGFSNVVGYDMDQAAEVLGEDGDIRVQIEDGMLVWRVAGGDGWRDGETLTLFWQSTLAPDGPADAYTVRVGEASAQVSGPFPPADEPEDGAEPR